MSKLRSGLTYANVMATVAVFIALGGGAYAAFKLPTNSVGAKQIKANAVTSSKIKDGSLLSKDFNPGQLPIGPQGPQGLKGDTGPQGPAGPGPAGPEEWHLVGSVVGEPQFRSNWRNNDASDPVRFYRDALGVVHLGGTAVPTSNTGNVMYTLPAGYRPSYSLSMVGLGCSTGAITVALNGDVWAGSGAGACTMDELTFRAG
ncbi:MAG: hypothetical protein QOC77_321 [Thermoleophilaceae bacterium]|jgi:hypothetical protein|nr:hypothetical protein [Thermoleophilaceae bacterium]